jgi:hypothetical protein
VKINPWMIPHAEATAAIKHQIAAAPHCRSITFAMIALKKIEISMKPCARLSIPLKKSSGLKFAAACANE